MDFPQCLLFIIIPILDARSWIKAHENNFIIDFYFIARIMHRITYHTRTLTFITRNDLYFELEQLIMYFCQYRDN